MKKSRFCIWSVLLCLLLLFMMPLSVKADTDTDTDTDTETDTDTDTDTGSNKIVGNFWDKDGTTLIYQIETTKKDGGNYLNEIMESDRPLRPVRRGYEIFKWYNASRDDYYSPNTCYTKFKFNNDFDLTAAVWKDKPYEFTIEYDLADGYFRVEESLVPKTFTVESEDLEFLIPVRDGYTFDGWYTDPKFKKKVTKIPKGTYIDTDKDGNMSTYKVYAKWTSVKPEKVKITSAKNNATGKVVVNYKKAKNAVGYEVLYSQDKKFTKNVHTIETKKNSVTVTFLPKGKTYYFKVRAYGLDCFDNKIYTDYSPKVSCKIKNGVSEVAPSSNSGTLKTVTVKKNGKLYVKVSVPKRLKSSDDYYYLAAIDPVTGKLDRVVAQTDKVKTVQFEVPVKDDKGNNLIEGKYALAVKEKKSYKVVSKASFIAEPGYAAGYTAEFPVRKSKKGLQGYQETDLNAKHTFLNMDLTKMLGGTIPYQYNGKTYYFNDAFGGYISNSNKLGMTVSGQVMMSWSESKSYLILPSAREPGHSYYALNAQDKKAREELEAAFCFMAEKYSTPECHLDNWILGNEVNIHQMWYYAGGISREEFMKNYADTFRLLYYAVKGSYKNARVYICTDHTWSDKANEWGAKNFINAFDAQIKSQNKNIEWNLAYHAYPANLLQSATWNDSGAGNDENCAYVTPKNLQVLTDYIENHFGKKTRIILSEQGFTSTCGEDVQAAGIAYTFYKAQFNDMIDAVIFRATYDQPAEIAQGLRMGLVTEDGRRKKAYDVFKYMDTPKYPEYTGECLRTIGIGSWNQIAPAFNGSIFKHSER